MKTLVHYLQATRMILAGLLFLFTTMPAVADPAPDSWAANAADKIVNAPATPDGSSGNGLSIDSPILIASAEELAYLAQQVNAGGKELILDNGGNIDKTGSVGYLGGFSGYFFALANDIDLKGWEWTPIGARFEIFSAHFDGKGHVVKGLKMKVNDDIYAGLFGRVENGTLQNLGVVLADEGIEVASNSNVYAGGIVGYLKSGVGAAATIRNCYVEGTGAVKITDATSADAGGIVGCASSEHPGTASVTHCYSTVGVEAAASDYCNAGGIVGYLFDKSKVSYTYATGKVTGMRASNQWVGGICGANNGGEITNSLALNKELGATGSDIHRIAGRQRNNATSSSNYASTGMLLNDSPARGTDAGSLEGADTYSDTFADDLKGPAGAKTEWAGAWDWTTEGNLPQLKVVVEDATTHSLSYPNILLSGQTAQKAETFLPATPVVHIVQPNKGGTLSVTYQQGGSVSTGTHIRPGTTLVLDNRAGTDYHFVGYLSGTDAGNITTAVSGTTFVMPDTDLWLTVRFRYQAPTPPPPPEPVYYNVTLPAVEGAKTDPIAGQHLVESWDNFRFYLTIDSAYSQSQPVVRTSRGEVITPRTSDGAYTVKYVRSDVEIYIEGIVKNPDPVANEVIRPAATPQMWTEGSVLCLRCDVAAMVRIYAADGRLLHNYRAAPGLNRRPLSPGLYIVQAGETVGKVIVK